MSKVTKAESTEGQDKMLERTVEVVKVHGKCGF